MTELVCSRLCHDIISPVGAISNGLELMSEFGNSKDADAMALVVSSAHQAVAKLSFFRMAYGQAGTRQTGMSFDEAANMLEPVVASPRVTLDWPTEQRPQSPLPAPGTIKLCLNLGLLAVEALPRGGTLRVTVTPQDNRILFSILAAAPDARLTDEFVGALTGTVAIRDLTPRTAQGALTRYLAERLGTKVTMSSNEGNGPAAGVAFEVSIPVAE
ncbi:MAG: histidine phosphotransferase family protein [Alphaproteobacteria bacterium]|nr:histidine phosphotransferase family protein [Alphaproteobacteria bacterium]